MSQEGGRLWIAFSSGNWPLVIRGAGVRVVGVCLLSVGCVGKVEALRWGLYIECNARLVA